MAPNQVKVVNPADLEKLVEEARADGTLVSEPVKDAAGIADYLRTVLEERLPIGNRYGLDANVDVVTRDYFQSAQRVFVVGEDLACCSCCLSACESLLREAIYETCRDPAIPPDTFELGLQKKVGKTLVPLANVAHALGLLNDAQRIYLIEGLAPFRDPFLHGNAAQLAATMAGEDFSTVAEKVDTASAKSQPQTLTLRNRVMVAPLFQKICRENAPKLLKMVVDLRAVLVSNGKTAPKHQEFPESSRPKKRGQRT